MDEQRFNAYIQLIKEILDSDSGEETDILHANPELLDAGLVQVMRAEAEMMAERGEGNANWLRDLAKEIETANYSLPRVSARKNAPMVWRRNICSLTKSDSQ